MWKKVVRSIGRPSMFMLVIYFEEEEGNRGFSSPLCSFENYFLTDYCFYFELNLVFIIFIVACVSYLSKNIKTLQTTCTNRWYYKI